MYFMNVPNGRQSRARGVTLFRELQDLREKAIIWQCQIRGKSPWSSECTEAVRPHLPV